MNKTLFINLATFSKVGGIENYNKNIIRALSADCELDVVSIYDSKSVYNEKVNFHNFGENKKKSIIFILRYCHQYDQIIASHINLLPVLILVKIISPKTRFFVSAHGIEVWKRFNFLYRYFLSKFVLLPVSSYTEKTMIELNHFKKNNFKLLFNCVDIDAKYTSINVFNDSEFNILTISRLSTSDKYKGVDTMIKTIPLLINSIPNLKYTIVGVGGDQERLKKLTNELNIEKYVDFKGFVEFIEPYYQYCDVFSLPSKGEGFGIVYIEAMKYKKPCIACNEGGQTDVVINNETGFLCEYDSFKCLSQSILKLHKDDDLRSRLGINGYKHLHNNFRFQLFSRRLHKIIKS
jgi:phosphatidyl-myo-inositol dimannoside synthase